MPNIVVGEFQIDFHKKKVKNIYLKVSKSGKVSLTAPSNTSDHEIKNFIISKTDWLKKHTRSITKFASQTTRRYVHGEQHYYWGEPYTLKIINSHQQQGMAGEVQLKPDGKLWIYKHTNNHLLDTSYLLNKWFNEQLRATTQDYLDKWQEVMNLSISSYRLKAMRSRWGSCHTTNAIITLNTELVKFPLKCLEYVVVHELAHLYEPSHNHRFKSIMSEYLPDWPESRKLLRDFAKYHDVGLY